jgi:Copper type II ascorbate-dependent monooxygenase, C-terminal domain
MKRGLLVVSAALIAAAVLIARGDVLNAAAEQGTVPTFTKDVAPILHRSCVTCHRPGEIAPMSLISYEETRPWSRSIKQKVVTRQMPPWFADPHFSDLKFQNDRTLTQKEVETIVAWADGGAPKGSDADMPPAPQFGAGWKFGQPDYVIKMPVPFELPAEGQVDYLSFYVPVPFDHDVFVEKIEMKPSNKAVVHHETGWTVTLRDDIKIVDGKPYSLDGKPLDKNELRPKGTTVFENPGNTKLICYVPGRGYEEHRPGTAKRIVAGKNRYILFDVHYQPSGKPEVDQSEIGLWFSKTPVTHEVITEMVGGSEDGTRIVEGREPTPELVTLNGVQRRRTQIPNIPPYAENWSITAITPITDAITLYGLSPHMHLRGKDMNYVVVYPDGTQLPILSVPKYDFNWQLYYDLEQPLKIPAGSKIVAAGHYDNSVKNRYNPAPEKEVYWSEQSWDEMYEPYIEYSVDSQDLKKQTTARPQR